jgi:titin
MSLNSSPEWMQPFSNCILQQGSVAVFEGVVHGSPNPIISWTWKGKPLKSFTGRLGRGKTTYYDEETGKVTLVIENLGPGDEGQYECRADNPYGDSTCTILVSL